MTRILSDFKGCWRLERQITHAHQPPARFLGTATWSPVQTGLSYHETGELSIPNHPPLRAERRFDWHEDLSVWFDDGRFFHKVPPMGGQTGHWCDPDQYDVRYDFSRWPMFRVTWQVKGPAKDYRMSSTYTPAD